MTGLFPCWGRHSRMGHNTLVGRFEVFVGTMVLCTVPELAGDEECEDLPGSRHVVPMEGPAFYGFDELTEEQALEVLADKRPRRPRRRVAYEEAVEVDENAGGSRRSFPAPVEGLVVTFKALKWDDYGRMRASAGLGALPDEVREGPSTVYLVEDGVVVFQHEAGTHSLPLTEWRDDWFQVVLSPGGGILFDDDIPF